MICKNCNFENKNDSIFCANCGKKINKKFKMDENVLKKLIIGLLLIIIMLLIIIAIYNNNSKNNSRTIMIYLDGSTLESNAKIVTAELDSLSRYNIDTNNIKILIYTGGTEKWHNFINNNENAIYEYTSSGFKKIESYRRLNMGDSKTLSDFLNYAYSNYKSDYYDLILYNHGGAIDGAIYDDFTGDNLTLNEFSTALNDSPFNIDNKMETVIFRTCLNGTIEVASVFEDYAKYLVFSEDITYGSNMTNVFGEFFNNLNSNSTGLEVGKKFIQSYVKQMSDIDPLGIRAITYSVIDLSKIKNVIEEMDSFISSVNVQTNYSNIVKIRTNMYQYGSIASESYDMVDLYSLIDELSLYSNSSSKNVLEAISKAVVYNYTNLDKSNGMSIYVPYNATRDIKNQFLAEYSKLKFSNNYLDFIMKFNNGMINAVPFNYDLSANKIETINYNKISLELTDEEANNYSQSIFILFKKDKDHPDYYEIVYSTNDVKLENNKLNVDTTNKLIKMTIDGDTRFFDYNHRKLGGIDNYVAYAVLIHSDKDIFDSNYSSSARVRLAYENNTPKIYSYEVISRDQRVEGIIFDINNYDFIQKYNSTYKILDDNGEIMSSDKWESAYIQHGLEGKLSDLKLSNASIDDSEEFYGVFRVFDVNNNDYYSKLVRIGD